MGLEDLGDLVLQTILLKLGPKNTAVFACVSRRCRVSASEEDLWQKFCSQDLDLSTPEDPIGNPTPFFKVTYKLWNEGFGMYPWPLVRRVKKCWSTINSWLAINFLEARNTLRKGVSEDELNELEGKLGLKLPVPTRLLYRFCDGQDIEPDSTGCALGLIGGYFFSDHAVNVCLLPLHEVIMETRKLSQLGFSTQSKIIVVAVSTYLKKMFLLNCTTGQLYVGTRNLATERQLMPCVPDALIRSVHSMDDGQSQDAMMLWLEEHGRRLESGMIRLREEEQIRSISLFPETSPSCSTAVTNGVQIRASAVFVPEQSDLNNELAEYCFSYSIRMRLMPQGCMLDGVYFSSCQLYWRHWIICANDAVVADVGGEAVIGKFPLLYPDGEEFVYESWTPMPSSHGSIEGAFTFVPGRLIRPRGRPFDVEVAQFPLEVPDYIF